METLLLTGREVATYADTSALIDVIESAFEAHGSDNALMPSKSYVDLPQYNGDFRSMPAYVRADEWDGAGVKWVNAHPDNPDDHDLPAVMGVMVYSDPETARPLAIMDGTELTRQRTAAAAAVATTYLARENATRLGVIGAGGQSHTQVEAIATVRSIDEIVVHDVDDTAVADFLERFADRFDVTPGSIREAAQCDILNTLTPVEDPIVTRADVGSQTHINAIGADAPGKQELDAQILIDATVVIDDYDQCTHSGEINIPWSAGTISDADLHGTIGGVVRGDEPDRSGLDGISVFDSTGLAIQDVAAARSVYEKADSDARVIDFLD